ALFTDDDKDGPSELAFKYAVYRINKDRTLLPNRTLVYDIQYVPKDDSFRASKKACNQLSSGVSAIFGPQDPLLGEHIQSLCDALDIPHIEARLDLETDLKEFSINLYPSPAIIGRALRELIVYLNWTKIAVIYEDDVSLIKLQQLVRPPLSKQVQFIFRKGNALSFRDVLIDVRARGVYSLIIDTRPESLPKILNAILQTQMNNYKYHYHFVTFDIEVYDLENFRYNFVNLTAFRLVDTEHPSVRQILRDMEKFQPKGQPILNRTNVLRVEPALVFDSVYVFARGLQSLDRGATLTPVNVSCDNETPWADGSSLFNYINSADLRGLTGRLTFKEGSRSTVKLDLLKLRSTELEKVGEWSTAGGLNISNHAAFHDFGTTNITLRVTTILSQPYVMIRGLSTTGGLSPANYSAYTNDQLEGFCVDLLKTIAENLKFQFELYLVPDGKYGAENTTTKEWNGLVREIIDKNADLAVASMTINYARESVIHFTKPYMNLGIGILFKLPSAAPTRLFSFMSPLDVDIWLYVLAAYIMVSMTMFIVARFSPNEWRSPHPCVAALEPMENQFSMANSFWFTIVTLMHQGCDLNPKAASTRIIGAIWWFFTLILVSSYTANLAAFLTVERMITPIQSVEDLATQSKIAYGTLEAGSTMTFFRDSQLETYQKMWRFMENRPSVFVKDYDEGVRRVNEGNYAFLMESAMLDYKVQRNCNLTQIGGLLDSKGYGIATPVGSPWRDKISLEILHLQEKGVIRMLYDRWWKRPGITCSRDDKSKEGKANALGVENIGGVFVVLLGGLAVAIVVAFIEFCINSKKNAQNLRQSLCTEMSDELRIAVKCHDSKQRPALKRKCSKCVTNSKHPSSGGGGGGNLCTDPDCTAGCDMMGGDMMGGGGGGGGCGHHQCTQSQHHVLEQHPNTCDDEGGLQEEQMLSTLVRSSTPGPGPSSSLGGQQSTGQQQQQQQQFDSDVELQRDEGMTPGNSARQITTTGSALSHYPMGTPGGGVGGGGPNRAIVDVECYTRGPTTSVIGVCRSGGGVGGYSLEPMLMTPLNGGLLDNGGGGSGGGGSGQYGMVNKGSLRNLAISQQQQQQQQIIENDTRPQYLNS
ncbi:PREDICTED: glutamate receptor ionotropic, kainate 2-like, partial [Rhagoletis zephyria]|uniref:glutamate receptor ionotropic, kainate 2-like n=1 Tax=Rhagoletis zephyria TaxID=28612 RepID=UPI0008114625